MGAPPAAAGVAKAYSPQHFVLDQILVDAAVAAGVQLRDGLSVQAVIGDGDRITGIRGRTKADSTVAEKGRLVVGADGRHSHVARSVQASESDTKPPLQGTDFTYWSGVPMEGFEFYLRRYQAVYAWLKNENLARIAFNWMGKDFSAVRADIEGYYLKVLDEGAPRLAKRARDSTREERWTGSSISDFIRKPYGPSWALVGDAGLHVDPCTVAGNSDTFRDAKLLAEATDEGFSGRWPLNEALAAYERWRGRSMTLSEAIETTRIHSVAGLTGHCTALVTT
jgi:flavin-dependent dehydrogenase